MAPDEPRPEPKPRNVARWISGALALLMVWSITSAPASIGQEVPIEEPPELSAYATFADAAPIQMYMDHQVRLVPLGPAIAHAQSEVSLPSTGAGIAWLVDGGVANGLHGTSTGSKVPTEASASQPGGDPQEEFSVVGGPIGNDAFMRAQAGRAFAAARHSNEPRGYANAYLKNLMVLPAAGGRSDPPGTFDPNDRYPGGDPNETDPAPRGQMAILSIGSIASTTESTRNGSQIVSVGVAELKDINIGNRTSDNRCTNCIRIDSIRAEAYAEANAEPGGSKAAYRVTLGRACRRAFNAETGAEEDRCLPLNPKDPSSAKGLQSIDELERLNEQFEEPIWTTITNGAVDYIVGIKIHAGTEHEEPSRAQRTTTPRDDTRRNYAYPDTRPKDPKNPKKGQINPDKDDGELAKAVAEGLDIEISTITVSQVANDVDARIQGTPAEQILREVDEDDQAPGLQVSIPGPVGQQTGQQTVPTDTIRSVRRVHLTLGVARASTTARPGIVVAPVPTGPTGGAGAPGDPFATGPGIEPGVPGEAPVAGVPGEPGTAAPGGGGGVPFGGKMKLRLDWASMRIAPWRPYDLAKAIGIIAIIAGAAALVRRRMQIGT